MQIQIHAGIIKVQTPKTQFIFLNSIQYNASTPNSHVCSLSPFADDINVNNIISNLNYIKCHMGFSMYHTLINEIKCHMDFVISYTVDINCYLGFILSYLNDVKCHMSFATSGWGYNDRILSLQ